MVCPTSSQTCQMAYAALQSGGGVQCPNNNCGIGTSTPFQCADTVGRRSVRSLLCCSLIAGFGITVALQLLRRRSVAVVDSTVWVSTDFHDLTTIPAIHDNRIGHLFTRLLERWLLCQIPVCFGLLDLKFNVAIAPKRCAFAGVPCRRNLHKLRFRLHRLCDVSVHLCPEALRVGALCGIKKSRV